MNKGIEGQYYRLLRWAIKKTFESQNNFFIPEKVMYDTLNNAIEDMLEEGDLNYSENMKVFYKGDNLN